MHWPTFSVKSLRIWPSVLKPLLRMLTQKSTGFESEWCPCRRGKFDSRLGNPSSWGFLGLLFDVAQLLAFVWTERKTLTEPLLLSISPQSPQSFMISQFCLSGLLCITNLTQAKRRSGCVSEIDKRYHDKSYFPSATFSLYPARSSYDNASLEREYRIWWKSRFTHSKTRNGWHC